MYWNFFRPSSSATFPLSISLATILKLLLFIMDFTRSETVLDLNNIREALVRMEDTILFDLIERAQFFASPAIYNSRQLAIPGSNSSLLDFVLLESEKTYSKFLLLNKLAEVLTWIGLVRRYEAPDEVPFFPGQLPAPILPANNYSKVLADYAAEINVNPIIKNIYIKEIVPLVSAGGVEQPENYGSCAICDIELLQALSRRIHFGKFVAEAKFQSERERFTKLILAQDAEGIDKAITNSTVEAQVLDRLEKKAEVYGVDPSLRWSQKSQGKITPSAARKIYKDWVIPLTKKVEVDYLLRRLEDDS